MTPIEVSPNHPHDAVHYWCSVWFLLSGRHVNEEETIQGSDTIRYLQPCYTSFAHRHPMTKEEVMRGDAEAGNC